MPFTVVKMIKTKFIGEFQNVIYHRVTGSISEKEAQIGANEAISLVSKILNNKKNFSLVLDMRGYIFDDLIAHKTWSLGFKEHPLLQNNVSRVALIADESSQLRAEQELMESDNIKFFTEPKNATNWIKNL